MHTINNAEWVEFTSNTIPETKSNRMLFSLHSHGIMYLVINVSIHYWKPYPVQVNVRLRLQLRNLIKI